MAAMVGDDAPCFVLLDQMGREIALASDHVAGTPVLLIFDRMREPARHGLIDALPALSSRMRAMAGWLFVLTRRDAESDLAFMGASPPAPPVLADGEGRLQAAYAIGPAEGRRFSGVLIGPSRRILAIEQDISPDHLQALLRLAGRHANRALKGGLAPLHAPVLVLEDLLPEGLAARLLAWAGGPMPEAAKEGLVTGGFAAHAGDFVIRQRTDYGRVDEHVLRSDPLVSELDRMLERRVRPAIARAFGAAVPRREDFRVARYTADMRGFIAPHRDNPTAETAHRRFTVTVNLNAGEYEGGELRFPEYGPHLYRPPTGGGVVWGAGLLHEVLPVQRGVRYMVGAHLF